MSKKYLISIIIISILFGANFAFAEMPETLDEAKSMGDETLKGFPGALKVAWQKAVSIMIKVWNWFKGIFRWIWDKALSLLGKEVEKRGPEIREEFKKETEEIKEDLPKTTKTLWNRFKDLIK